jgi:hypothetical protein
MIELFGRLEGPQYLHAGKAGAFAEQENDKKMTGTPVSGA